MPTSRGRSWSSSALVGHVLSVYQRHYAGEAFISTAQAPSSLVRHAHRLAYDPDPGLAASGYVVLFTKERVGGTVAAGLPLASVPLGEIKAQDYETRDDLVVDAVAQRARPARARGSRCRSSAGRRRAASAGSRPRARARRPGRALARSAIGAGFIVEEATEDPAEDATTVRLDGDDRRWTLDVASSDPPPALLAHPARTLRPFGADADPALFPPDAQRNASGTMPRRRRSRSHWYEVQRADGGGYVAEDIYLSEQAARPLVGRLRPALDGLRLRGAAGEARGRGRRDAPPRGGGAVRRLRPSRLDPTKRRRLHERARPRRDGKQVVRSHVSGTVTAIQVADQDGDRRAAAGAPVPGATG